MERINLLGALMSMLVVCAGWPLTAAASSSEVYYIPTAQEAYQHLVTDSDGGHFVLSLGKSQTTWLQRPSELRTFYYHGSKDEAVTIKVSSAQFSPQVFLRDANDVSLSSNMNPEAGHEIKLDYTFTAEGDYKIQVRAMGSGQGLFQVEVDQGDTADQSATSDNQ